MDATCMFCGNPADPAAPQGSEATCGTCAHRRRTIFDVSESFTARREAPTLPDAKSRAPSSRPDETRMLDLRELAKRTREALETVPEIDDGDVPLSVREAILLVDSIAPASIEEAPGGGDPAEPPAPASSRPSRRLRAITTGVGLVVVMVGLVAAKARMGREVASAAPLAMSAPVTPEQAKPEPMAPPLPAAQAPSPVASPVAATPSAAPRPTAAPTTTPRKAPVRRAPPRPRAPVAADPPALRADAERPPTSRVNLLDAMVAAVAAHSGPPAAAKRGCPPTPPGSPASPSPCARGATRTSPPRP